MSLGLTPDRLKQIKQWHEERKRSGVKRNKVVDQFWDDFFAGKTPKDPVEEIRKEVENRFDGLFGKPAKPKRVEYIEVRIRLSEYELAIVQRWAKEHAVSVNFVVRSLIRNAAESLR
jgi:hypothetical protein